VPTITRPGRRPAKTPRAEALPDAPTLAKVVDWRADERVRRIDERDAELAFQAEEAAAAVTAAVGARDAALAAHAAEEAAYLRGETDERPAVPADGVREAQDRVDALARDRARLAEFRPAIEAQARDAATAALLEVYRPAVARLLAAVEAARAANTAVRLICEAGHDAGFAVPALAWHPLQDGGARMVSSHFLGGHGLAAWHDEGGRLRRAGPRRQREGVAATWR
jgi:hypothetical protein